VYPYHLPLESVVGTAATDAITSAGSISFHVMGDTGGIKDPQPQLDVAAALELDLSSANKGFTPSFLYLLGDCIYFFGEELNYYDQFYDPYTHYTLPIMAVPGNHDGALPGPGATTLDGFMQNFCSASPQTNAQAGSSGRTTMTQPNVYWTLEAPFVTVIGLYTNVSESDGALDDTQITWLSNELKNAPADTPVLVTMHHPPISADDHYGSATNMFQVLDNAISSTGIAPTAVLAGHVHNYQRFTRSMTVAGTSVEVPYLVIGAGGYHNLHAVAADAASAQLPWQMPSPPGVMLDAFDDVHFGYGRVTISPTRLDFQFVAVTESPAVAANAIVPQVVDSFSLDLTARTVGPFV
jgi:hypothetical protein